MPSTHPAPDAIAPGPHPAAGASSAVHAATEADLLAHARDRERVQAWLDARAGGARAVGPSTLSQYRMEAERVCWYARAVGKPIARWQREDAHAYLRFLQDPPAWAISARGHARDEAGWTPLRGPLSARSLRQCSVIAANLCGWLQRSGHLRANPFLDDDGIVIALPDAPPATLPPAPPPPNPATALCAPDMALLVDAVRTRVALGREARLRQARDGFLAELLAHAGLRVAELVGARMGDVALHAVPEARRAADPALPPSVWLLGVGAGRAQRWLPCDALMATLRAYRTAFGLSPLPLPGEATPLLLSVRKRSPRRADGTIIDSPALRRDFGERRGIGSRSQLLQIIKAMLAEAAEHARALGHADAAERLAHASLRGLRGAHLRERLASGEAARDIAHALGLAALPSTAVRARKADLTSSILDAARQLAVPRT
ncbi:integrase [Ralstonia pseudosolanacearum]|uniref:integrase n=1 Tax=Ralstonia pseudosolanacearum TaxID=1310165 RepID=UPI001FFA88D2